MMADHSAIEWTGATWNPVTGCSKVSPGCAHCYAERIQLRFGRSAKPWTPENAEANVVLHPERLDARKVARLKPLDAPIFVCSMSDLFHEQVPAPFLDSIFDVMATCPERTFQVLTKRLERALVDVIFYGDPLPNVWLGVSIENARYTWRADVLREIPAAVRFISAEPLLGSLLDGCRPCSSCGFPMRGKSEPLMCGDCREYGPPREQRDWSEMWARSPRPLDLSGIDWLIVGGESGPGARPMRPEWARELRDATLCTFCRSDGVRQDDCGLCGRTAFFFKQWGGRTSKSGGRLLDGREWNEMPLAMGAIS